MQAIIAFFIALPAYYFVYQSITGTGLYITTICLVLLQLLAGGAFSQGKSR